MSLMQTAYTMMLLPLVGALIAGLMGKTIGRKATHSIVIALIACSFTLSCYLFCQLVMQGHSPVVDIAYTWAHAGSTEIDVTFLLDRLSAVMAVVVTFVSFMVYVYAVGYMAGDPGYQRFFSYISLFTFAMLVLVLANNFLILFFGWEGVGLVSYLLIGFWFKRERANVGSLKAFLVNRVGDVGFVLAMAVILNAFGTLQYQEVFNAVPRVLANNFLLPSGASISVVTLICLLLFIGAMGKSAQVPLHVWLPESMEGPTPISALIHAATMVTAGIYMVARMSPLFEYSALASNLILIIGATTCLLMGILAIFQFDIKRVIAYSTLSQLGYMAVALGVSAYDAAIFHLVTHAFFKALLFLAAGSVIIAMHHEQDIRKMGGLATKLPITYLSFLIGSLALAALPPFSGFYSKDIIIEATRLSTLPGAKYAFFCVQIGAFITALYIFRAFFLTFHTKKRWNLSAEHQHVQESPWVVLLPLLGLVIPSVFVGMLLVQPMLFNDLRLLGDSVFILPKHDLLSRMAIEYRGPIQMAIEALQGPTFLLVLAGIITAWLCYVAYPSLAETIKKKFPWINAMMAHQYGFDDFNQAVFVDGIRETGSLLYNVTDLKLIDGFFVNGSGKSIRWFSRVVKLVQTGYLYHYVLVMVLGLIAFLIWCVVSS